MVIRWTEPAVADITNLCNYTRDHFGTAQARRTALTILDAVESLKPFPNRGRVGRKSGTREMVIPNFPFLVIYSVREEGIEIARILHGAQKWP